MRRKLVLPMMAAIVLTGCAGSRQPPTAAIGRQTLNVAYSALAGDNPQMALSITNIILKSDPNDPDSLVARGDAYYLLNDCLHAAADYRHALAVKAEMASAELGLGRCALRQDPRTATGDFARATKDEPGNAAAFNDLGIARAEQGNFVAAIMAFHAALAVDPRLRAARVNLGMALALGGKPGAGAAILGPLAGAPGATPMIRADYATALVLSGRADAARHILLADMPSDAAASAIREMSHLASSAAMGKAD